MSAFFGEYSGAVVCDSLALRNSVQIFGQADVKNVARPVDVEVGEGSRAGRSQSCFAPWRSGCNSSDAEWGLVSLSMLMGPRGRPSDSVALSGCPSTYQKLATHWVASPRASVWSLSARFNHTSLDCDANRSQDALIMGRGACFTG
jgi:hypothetical protein